MERTSIAAVVGGRTVEHGLSLESATRLSSALAGSRFDLTTVVIDPRGRFTVADPFDHLRGFDYVMPLVHGDEGGLHGLLALLDVPVLGESASSSAIALDKPLAKRLLREAGLPVLYGLTISRREIAARPREMCARIAREVGVPCFVKPASGVASVGATPVYDMAMLCAALIDAATYDSRVLVEPWIDAREIEVGVLGGLSSIPGELVFRADFHDHATKCEPGKLELVLPAMVEPADADRIRAMAVTACNALEIEAVGRVEFFIDRNTHRITVNEVNAVPAFSAGAVFPRLWEASSLDCAGQIDRLVEVADARSRDRFRTRHQAPTQGLVADGARGGAPSSAKRAIGY